MSPDTIRKLCAMCAMSRVVSYDRGVVGGVVVGVLILGGVPPGRLRDGQRLLERHGQAAHGELVDGVQVERDLVVVDDAQGQLGQARALVVAQVDRHGVRLPQRD
jgi:hypothetical protein